MWVGEGQEHLASKFGEYGLCPFLTYFLNIYWTRISPSVLLVGRSGRLQVGVRWVNCDCTKSKQRKNRQASRPGCWSVPQALRALGPLSVIGLRWSLDLRRSNPPWLEPCCRFEGGIHPDPKDSVHLSPWREYSRSHQKKKGIQLVFVEIHDKNRRSLEEAEDY